MIGRSAHSSGADPTLRTEEFKDTSREDDQ
jgi:hypothetical protein